MDKLKLIKFLVAALTFLIIFGMLSAAGIIYKKTRTPEIPAAAVSLAQPAGTTIENYKIIDSNLYVLAKNGGLPDRIIIVNPRQPQNRTVININ